MTFKNSKVLIATAEEFNSFKEKNPHIKYIDAILSDLSGVIRGKRLPINDAEKLLWCQTNSKLKNYRDNNVSKTKTRFSN